MKSSTYLPAGAQAFRRRRRGVGRRTAGVGRFAGDTAAAGGEASVMAPAFPHTTLAWSNFLTGCLAIAAGAILLFLERWERRIAVRASRSESRPASGPLAGPRA